MKTLLAAVDDSALDLRQLIKLIVYSLLLINFALYIRDDWVIASFTMRNGGTFIDWTRAFATTIDESAWIVLLILFELETYILSDKPRSRPKAVLMHGTRIICYVSLAHTLYAYGIYVYELSGVTPIANITKLCQLVGSDVSYAYNLLYTELEAANCLKLSSASQFFYIDPPQFIIVSDGPGLVVERQLAWVDLMEAATWLLILFTIEAVVWLQDRGIFGGAMIHGLNLAKYLLYGLLWLPIAYWIFRGHIMFAWDEIVWIAGFVAIEMNVVQWRQEIIEEQSQIHGSNPGLAIARKNPSTQA